MKRHIITALKLFIFLTLLTGVIYPLVITLFADVAFPEKSQGSIIKKDGILIGSELIGQKFVTDKYFWGRPSAIDYNPMPSGGSNLGPTSKALLDSVNSRIDSIKNHQYVKPGEQIPKDLLFASASGVDPDIRPEDALFQVDRIAKARNFNSEQKKKLTELVKKSVISPDLWIFGEDRVNVLNLNLALDKLVR